jgi:hypothetical protein
VIVAAAADLRRFAARRAACMRARHRPKAARNKS